MAYLEYYEAALSTFKRIYEPHIHTGGEWKNVHKVHIRHGGEWELAHRTDKSRYVRDTANQFEGTSGGNYTIPNGTRYVLAEMFSGGGGAGGGIRTGGSGASGGHFICPWNGSTVTDYATGGRGGHGYMLELWFEVEPGMYFRWDSSGNNDYGGGSGGAVGSPLELPYASAASVGTTRSGSWGYDGADAYLDIYANATDGASQNNPVINIACIGGSGGGGGTVTVANNCFSGAPNYLYGYGVTASTGAAGADGGKSIEIQNSAYSVEEIVTDESNDNGGTGNSNATGGQGWEGEMRFYPYKAA